MGASWGVQRAAIGCAIVLVLLAFIPDARAAREQPERLTWLLNDFPPAIMIGATLPGRGFTDDFVRHLVAHMPAYDHVFEEASIARAVGLMQQGQPACHPNLLVTPDRLPFIDFSGPMHFALPHHVIVRRDRMDRLRPYIGADGTIDAGELVRDAQLVTTITERRAFPPIVADAIAAIGDQTHVVRANVDFQTPFRQLAAGWIEYVFAYPIEVKWYTDQTNLPIDSALEYLPIRGIPDYVTGHVGCTKGEWGRRMVEQIDEIARAAGARPPWFDAQLKFMDAAGTRRLEEVFARYRPFGSQPPAGD